VDEWVLLLIAAVAAAGVLSGYLRFRTGVLTVLLLLTVVAAAALAVRVRFTTRRGLAAGPAWKWAWSLEAAFLLGTAVLTVVLLVRDNPFESYAQMLARVRDRGFLTLLGRREADLFLLFEMLAVFFLFVLLGLTVLAGAGSAAALYATAGHRSLSALARFGGPGGTWALVSRPLGFLVLLVAIAVAVSPWWAETWRRLTTVDIPGG
jgi:hypothetical protein